MIATTPNIHIQPEFHPSIPYPCIIGPSHPFVLIVAAPYCFSVAALLFGCMSIGPDIMAIPRSIFCM